VTGADGSITITMHTGSMLSGDHVLAKVRRIG
jgi:hypothetical protein